MRVQPGTSDGIPVRVPESPADASITSFAHAATGQTFVGVRKAGIYAVKAGALERVASCEQMAPTIACNADFRVMTSQTGSPLVVTDVVYRLEGGALKLVGDTRARFPGSTVVAAGDNSKGDVFIALRRPAPSLYGDLVRVAAGATPTATEEILERVDPPAGLAVRSDGTVYVHSGAKVTEVRFE